MVKPFRDTSLLSALETELTKKIWWNRDGTKSSVHSLVEEISSSFQKYTQMYYKNKQ